MPMTPPPTITVKPARFKMAPTLMRTDLTNKVKLEWTMMLTNEGYVLQRSTAEGEFATIYEGKKRRYADKVGALQRVGGEFTYRVAAKKTGGGLWPWSSIV